MIAVDASVLIGHLNPADAHHDEATHLLLRAEPRSLLVHPMTLAEVLVGGVRIGQGAQMEADLLATGLQVSVPDLGEPLRLAGLRVSSGLKLPDCCVLDNAITTRAALATFDQAIAAAARRHGVVVNPVNP